MKRLVRALLVLACSACAVPAHAQSLVLSGGGARGLSHAGALVALEELGYDPSLVVGTSMGAIIGALYAAGYDAAAIRDIIAGENWLERFAPEPLLLGPARAPRRPLLVLGIGDRPFEGLVATTGVNQRLVELLFDAGVRAGGDFDALPRRYRAVAADLATGEQVVLGGGDLPRAVRASMAVPGAFAPVRIDDRVLVDGGIINNLPVSVARALGGVPVVAIDVLRPGDDLRERSAAGVGVRALRLLIGNAMHDTVPADVLILPRIGEALGESRFPADASPLIRAGYRAALEQAPRYQGAVRARTMVADLRPARIDSIAVDADAATARLVRRMMASSLGVYDAGTIVRRAGALYATGLFDGVWPRVERRGGASVLVMDVAPVAATSAAGGASWNNDIGAAGWAVLRQRLPLITPWELRAAFEADQLGQRGTADVSIHSTLFPGVTWTVGAHSGAARVRTFSGDSVSGHVDVQRTGAWAGAELHAPLRVWYVSALLRATRAEGRQSWGPRLRVARAPQPERVVGIDPWLDVERGFGDAFARVHARSSVPVRSGRALAALSLDAAAVDGDVPVDVLPATSSATAPWLPQGSLRGRHLFAAGADVAYPTVLDGYVRLRVRALRSSGQGNVLLADYGGELGAVWPTVAGALEVGVAAGRGTRGPRLNLSLNAWH